MAVVVTRDRDGVQQRSSAIAQSRGALFSRTAVLVGYGSIGREVARQLAALGLRLTGGRPFRENEILPPRAADAAICRSRRTAHSPT